MYVRGGIGDRDDGTDVPIRMEIKAIRVHTKYSEFDTEYDIAIIALQSPVQFSAKLLPVCLPTDPEPADVFASGVVAGWGRTEDLGNFPKTLQKANVDLMTSQECRKNSDYSSNSITNRIICARSPGKDACQGDSGGPLMVNKDGAIEAIGIVSWGVGCADERYPGIYTKIYSYRTWIKAMTITGTQCRADRVAVRIETHDAGERRDHNIFNIQATDSVGLRTAVRSGERFNHRYRIQLEPEDYFYDSTSSQADQMYASETENARQFPGKEKKGDDGILLTEGEEVSPYVSTSRAGIVYDDDDDLADVLKLLNDELNEDEEISILETLVPTFESNNDEDFEDPIEQRSPVEISNDVKVLEKHTGTGFNLQLDATANPPTSNTPVDYTTPADEEVYNLNTTESPDYDKITSLVQSESFTSSSISESRVQEVSTAERHSEDHTEVSRVPEPETSTVIEHDVNNSSNDQNSSKRMSTFIQGHKENRAAAENEANHVKLDKVKLMSNQETQNRFNIESDFGGDQDGVDRIVEDLVSVAGEVTDAPSVQVKAGQQTFGQSYNHSSSDSSLITIFDVLGQAVTASGNKTRQGIDEIEALVQNLGPDKLYFETGFDSNFDIKDNAALSKQDESEWTKQTDTNFDGISANETEKVTSEWSAHNFTAGFFGIDNTTEKAPYEPPAKIGGSQNESLIDRHADKVIGEKGKIPIIRQKGAKIRDNMILLFTRDAGPDLLFKEYHSKLFSSNKDDNSTLPRDSNATVNPNKHSEEEKENSVGVSKVDGLTDEIAGSETVNKTSTKEASKGENTRKSSNTSATQHTMGNVERLRTIQKRIASIQSQEKPEEDDSLFGILQRNFLQTLSSATTPRRRINDKMRSQMKPEDDLNDALAKIFSHDADYNEETDHIR
ncbi:hypothetical protein HAZT_HAZT004103 [Hyalella azteca]|uniref:Peptidase S1 domain-containing protein n=1 Tax=Hyalella azteca TaxID=294128 RepID=A0A6A0GPS1_HYAAZ|nr:hypothetical protein HAZT_HAZT004103 [Hyalella azteca]